MDVNLSWESNDKINQPKSKFQQQEWRPTERMTMRL